MFFIYPNDSNAFAVDSQFFYGDPILVSPVTEENSAGVEIYLPNDLCDDFYTYAPVQGKGAKVHITDIDFTDILLHIKSGYIVLMRNSLAYTTTDVCKQPFSILVAPNSKGEATGSLCLGDGVSIEQEQISDIRMEYKDQVLSVSGNFGYTAENSSLLEAAVLGVDTAPKGAYRTKSTNETVW
jgi:alpha-glucosidase